MWATQVTSHVSLHSCQAVHQFTGIDWAEILHGIDIVSTTQTSVKCSAAKYSWIDDSLVHVGWSSWCVHCARGGSRDRAKGTCLSRSQRLTCYGQMTAWPLTGLLPACPTCQHPRPSFQDMRSRTTHLGSICLLRSVFTSDFSSTLGCCLRLYQFSIVFSLSLMSPCITFNAVLCIWDQLPHTLSSPCQHCTLKHSSHMIACQ